MNPMTIKPNRYESVSERYGYLVSTSLPIEGISIADFLSHAYGQERFYWQDARSDVAFAGCGVATVLTAWGDDRFQTIQREAQDLFEHAVNIHQEEYLAKPRLFGGFAFRDDFTPDNTWSVFYPAHFVLPHYQMVSANGQSWLTINIHLPMDEPYTEILPQLEEALQFKYEALQEGRKRHALSLQDEMIDVKYPMSYPVWERMIRHATDTIQTGALEKVVLSRVCEINFAHKVPVDSALAYLNETYTDCYRFLFEPQPYHAFYGATPELLLHTTGDKLETMGLAGSIRRGNNADEDQYYAEQIFNDPKERLEHDLVVQALKNTVTRVDN